jgi:hypothetical protein
VWRNAPHPSNKIFRWGRRSLPQRKTTRQTHVELMDIDFLALLIFWSAVIALHSPHSIGNSR